MSGIIISAQQTKDGATANRINGWPVPASY